MDWQSVDISILGPAFVAGLLILSTHVPLGQSVLKRGIIFIDLAIAQFAGLGVIVADSMGWHASSWQVQASAVSAAVLGAIMLHWSDKRFPKIQEALIGITFVLAATMGLLLLANNPHGGEQLKDLLVGQILWVSYEQLLPIALLYVGVLSVWFYFDIPKANRLGFYLLFALTVTASVQLVGIYLVFASLIIPALATRTMRGPRALIFAYTVGIVGYAGGLVLSALLDLPSGAVIVWMLAFIGILTSMLITNDE